MTDIIILALISLILCVRLFLLFGQKRNIHRHPIYGCCRGDSCSKQAMIKEAEINMEKITDPAARIKALDASFKMEKFLQDAQQIYKNILSAYSKGDTQALSAWLNINMMSKFAYEISKREEKGLNHMVEILKIKDAGITNVACDKDGLAQIQVIFHSDVIHYKTNNDQTLVEGNKTKVESKEDTWIFSKNLKFREQPWKLVDVNQLL